MPSKSKKKKRAQNVYRTRHIVDYILVSKNEIAHLEKNMT